MLTERQSEIKERLERGMSAREVADDLQISRNAVYQQIQRMRRHGELPRDYTPTGQPIREGYGTSPRDPLPENTSTVPGIEFDADGFVKAFLAKEQRRKSLVAELEQLSGRLAEIASELA